MAGRNSASYSVSHKTFYASLFVLLFMVMLLAGISALQQRQVYRSKAATPTCSIDLCDGKTLKVGSTDGNTGISCELSSSSDVSGCVSYLEYLLKSKACMTARIDGSFGDVTKTAVIQFEKAAGILADGIVGPLTWSKLATDLTCSGGTNPPPPPADNPPPPAVNPPPPSSGSNVTLALKIKLIGILEKPSSISTLSGFKVTLSEGELAQDKTNSNVTFVSDDDGVWSASVVFTNVPVGDGYKIFIKGPRHIQKRICDNEPTEDKPGVYNCEDATISLTSGTNNLDFSGIQLLAGDLPLPQDGVVDSKDMAFIRNNLGSKGAATIAKGDLNLDGVLDTQDFDLLISSLSIKYDDN